VLLTGQRVEPRATREAGFRFSFTDINAAFTDIISERGSGAHKRSA
jgi:NAD dependent epimerase/dehydratase family enzyme